MTSSKSGYNFDTIFFDTEERLSSVGSQLLAWADEDKIDREVVTLIELTEQDEFKMIPAEFLKRVVEHLQRQKKAVFEFVDGEPSVKFLLD